MASLSFNYALGLLVISPIHPNQPVYTSPPPSRLPVAFQFPRLPDQQTGAKRWREEDGEQVKERFGNELPEVQARINSLPPTNTDTTTNTTHTHTSLFPVHTSDSSERETEREREREFLQLSKIIIGN